MFRLVLAALISTVWAFDSSVNPVVNTTDGPIFGFTTQFGTISFRGVPYASPPVGQLRFASPQPNTPWLEPKNATRFGPGCVAKCNGKFSSLMCAETVSEDCLYLNIYTPSLTPPSGSNGYPVIFFIHGGMFTWGAGGIPLYDGSLWAQKEQVIVVTINYRLNVFGALYTDTVKGNFNIQDQRQALIWVRNNIAAFGGDPNLVTLSGQSAGATSVGIHLTSPLSYPYFQRAAIISNPYGIHPNSAHIAKELGTMVLLELGCPSGGQQELDCLRNKTADEILAMEKVGILPDPKHVLQAMMVWQPTVDGLWVPQLPLDAMMAGNFSKVPLYIGTVANETIPFIFGIPPQKQLMLDIALTYIWGLTNAQKILQLYGPPVHTDDVRAYFSRVLTDYTFYCPSRLAARQAAKHNGNHTYMYFFDEHPSWALWYANNNTQDPCVLWICHAFDLPSIFNTYYELPVGFPAPTKAEQKMSRFIQGAWKQFATEGKITGKNWPVFSGPSWSAYNISVPIPTSPLPSYREKFCDFFDSIGYGYGKSWKLHQ